MLYEEYMTPCTLITKTSNADGEGGRDCVQTSGVKFQAAIVLDKTDVTRNADKESIKNTYTVTVSRAFPLRFHNVFRRDSDGQVFRVTSNSDDKMTPPRATMDMAQVVAEEWQLPNEYAEVNNE